MRRRVEALAVRVEEAPFDPHPERPQVNLLQCSELRLRDGVGLSWKDDTHFFFETGPAATGGKSMLSPVVGGVPIQGESDG